MIGSDSSQNSSSMFKPDYYNSHPSGVECVQIAQHHNFNIGNVFKYIWRAGLKPNSDTVEDLMKARKYIDFEILRLQSQSGISK